MKLSFVIPTLNFGAFLPETLDSLVDEGYADIEIIVFDGGSTDDTLAVLERYRDKFAELKIVCATERGNIDTDLNAAVAHASGDYIWTMSADDVLMPGWSRTVIGELSSGPDLLLVPAIHCDVQMTPRRNYPILRKHGGTPQRMRLASDDDLVAYLDTVRSSEGLFSFCSACIVRRDRLLQVPTLEAANGTCWRYSARLIAVLADYPSTIAILGRPLVYKRGDNDSFSHAGPIRRLRIATSSWDRAIAAIGLDNAVTRALARHAKADIRATSLLYLTQFIASADERDIYNECVASRLGSGTGAERALAGVLRRFPRVPLLRNALLIARPAYRRLMQRLRSAQLQTLATAPAAEDR